MNKKWLKIALCLMGVGLVIGLIGFAMAKFDFKELNTVKMVKNTHVVEESFTNIQLSTSAADITFQPSADGKISVVCYERDAVRHNVQVENNTLVIQKQNNQKWYKNLGISLESPTITIYLPAGDYEELQLKCTTGDVNVPADFTFSKANVKVTTGDVAWKADVANDLTIHGTTGSITLENVLCNQLYVKTTTGDVKLSRVDAEQIEIKTTTGDVTGTLLSDKIFQVKNTTGNVDVPETTEGGICRVKATTGDIHITIE